jgi:hypothetical protein
LGWVGCVEAVKGWTRVRGWELAMQKARGGECVGGDCGEVEEDAGKRIRGDWETGRRDTAIGTRVETMSGTENAR